MLFRSAQLDAITAAVGEPDAVFRDEGISGSSAKRPGLHAALDALAEGDTLAVAKRDRLARDVMLSGWIEKEVKRRGARIVSAAGEGTEADDPASRLMRTMIDAFAQYEREIIGERIKAALAVKRDRGEKTGGDVPFGYRLAQAQAQYEADPGALARAQEAVKRLEVNETETRALDLMSELHQRGLSLRAICAELEKRGIPTKQGKTAWHPQVVKRLLKRAA